MFRTIAGGVCVGILLAYRIIKDPKSLWDLIRTIGALLLIPLAILLPIGIIGGWIYFCYYLIRYGDNPGSSNFIRYAYYILVAIGWIVIIGGIISLIISGITKLKNKKQHKINEGENIIEQNKNDNIHRKKRGTKKNLKKKMNKVVENKS